YNRIIQRPLVVTQDIAGNLTEDPCKVIAIELHDADKLERFKQAVDEKYGDVFTTCYSNPYYLEIYMKESGKGSAVKRLAEYLDVPISNTYAAGDEMNDISMIEAAGCGIAMINASDEVKAHADVITKTDNNRDGLAELIRSAI
ncbi:MAG: HAD-IIB family hydrolase, partial [Lachnospiraceae bacterium]|nr:HAD-IIB family hydrolase [Lachnospiraceae bacterium]